MDCFKQGYVSKSDAKEAAKCLKILGVTGSGRKGTVIKRGRLTPYLCKDKECGMWHLTSKK